MITPSSTNYTQPSDPLTYEFIDHIFDFDGHRYRILDGELFENHGGGAWYPIGHIEEHTDTETWCVYNQSGHALESSFEWNFETPEHVLRWALAVIHNP